MSLTITHTPYYMVAVTVPVTLPSLAAVIDVDVNMISVHVPLTAYYGYGNDCVHV